MTPHDRCHYNFKYQINFRSSKVFRSIFSIFFFRSKISRLYCVCILYILLCTEVFMSDLKALYGVRLLCGYGWNLNMKWSKLYDFMIKWICVQVHHGWKWTFSIVPSLRLWSILSILITYMYRNMSWWRIFLFYAEQQTGIKSDLYPEFRGKYHCNEISVKFFWWVLSIWVNS